MSDNLLIAGIKMGKIEKNYNIAIFYPINLFTIIGIFGYNCNNSTTS
jgi:hypothetical protein